VILVRKAEIAVIGGGPAGLCAAVMASRLGARVALMDDGEMLGGQLTKQTHQFFGSQDQNAGIRGVDIAALLSDEARQCDRVEVLLNASVTGLYEDRMITVVQEDRFIPVEAGRIIMATGATENMLAFPNNDLPGIYGAGAVQTLMNVHGVIPGQHVLMVGAGNIGLIVSYQLMQAGVSVEAVVEALPQIGGYWVHASKIRRCGVPIYTRHTIKEAHGEACVQGATIWELDEHGGGIPGTERDIPADTLCLAVGLSPLADLLWQAGCEMRYVAALGGWVPIRHSNLQTTAEGIYIAGDVAGIEEASTAMLEGRLAGLEAAISLGYESGDAKELSFSFLSQLDELRGNPSSEELKKGLDEITIQAEREPLC
jgi:sarcosine oxidase subunit alpha